MSEKKFKESCLHSNVGKKRKEWSIFGITAQCSFSTVYNSSLIRACVIVIIIIIIIIMKLLKNTVVRRITKFLSTKDRINDSGPIRL